MVKYFSFSPCIFKKTGYIKQSRKTNISAFVAQSVEQVTLNHWVHGSSPCERTIFFVHGAISLCRSAPCSRRRSGHVLKYAPIADSSAKPARLCDIAPDLRRLVWRLSPGLSARQAKMCNIAPHNVSWSGAFRWAVRPTGARQFLLIAPLARLMAHAQTTQHYKQR